MEQSFELASTTPITVADLREAAGEKRIRSRLYDYYVAEDSAYAAQIVTSGLDASAQTLEALGDDLDDDYRRLFALAQAFQLSLGRQGQTTTVPGHGTIGEVSVADGPLNVHQNLLVEGTLIVPDDVTVGGQVIVGPEGLLIITGSLHAPALVSAGRMCVGEDIRGMFFEIAGGAVHLGGELDAFLLIQNACPTLASSYSIGLHAVIEGDPADVFLPPMLDLEGKPDWNRIAQAAQEAEDVFKLSYETPRPGEHQLVELIET